MNKSIVIDKISEKSGLSKSDSEKALDAFEDTVNEAMASGEEVNLSNFVKFHVVDVAEREHTNPQTKEKFTTPAHKAVKVKIMKELKESVK
jgi:DNA-binding protein HU-beta